MEAKMPKEKKEKKRKIREEETVEEVVTEVGGDLDDEEVAAKKARKEAKRLRKLEKKKVDIVEDETEEAVVEEAPKKVKKDKKEKSRESSILADIVKSQPTKLADGGKKTANNYVEHASTTAMTSTEIAAYREEVGLQVIPEEDALKYNPMTSFEFLTPSLQNFCPG